MKPSLVFRIFQVCCFTLCLFVAIPLLATIFSTSTTNLYAAITDPEVLRSIWITFSASGTATIAAMIIGIPTSYLLARYRFPARRIILSLLDLPIIVPHTAAGLALLLVFGSNGLLGKFGINFLDSFMGVSTAMAFVSMPYLINYARQAFSGIDPEMERSAQVDGASLWQTFIHISLPQASNGILSGIIMMWSRGISEFGAIVILAYHPKVLPVLLFERFQGFGLEAAKPLAVIMIAIVFFLFLVSRFLVKEE